MFAPQRANVLSDVNTLCTIKLYLLGIHICRRCLTHKELMKEGHCMGPADFNIEIWLC